MIPLLATIPAIGLSLAVDAVAWSLARFADLAEPASVKLADAAESARWYAAASRLVP